MSPWCRIFKNIHFSSQGVLLLRWLGELGFDSPWKCCTTFHDGLIFSRPRISCPFGSKLRMTGVLGTPLGFLLFFYKRDASSSWEPPKGDLCGLPARQTPAPHSHYSPGSWRVGNVIIPCGKWRHWGSVVRWVSHTSWWTRHPSHHGNAEPVRPRLGIWIF